MLHTFSLIAAILFPVAAGSEPADVAEALESAVFLVEVLDENGSLLASGSAVAISVDRAVTNCHVVVVENVGSIRVGGAQNAAVRDRDLARDLCTLDVPGLKARPPRIRPLVGLRPGERVIAIGSPLGLTNTISEGLLASIRNDPDGGALLQTSAAISPGSSGGGLFDLKGNLIGITSSQLRGGQNLNFAIPAEYIGQIEARSAQQARDIDAKSAAAVRRIGELALEWRLADSRYDEKLPQIQAGLKKIIEGGSPPDQWAQQATALYEFVSWNIDAEKYFERKEWYALSGHAQKWIQASPTNFYAHFVLGRAYEGIADAEVQRAGAIARNIMNLPYEEKAIGAVAMDQHSAMAAGARANAISAMKESLRLNSSFVQAWQRLGQLYVQDGDLAAATSVASALDGLGQTSAAQELREYATLYPR